MLRAYIVDDNQNDRTLIKTMLTSWNDQIEVIGEADNVEKAVAFLQQDRPDVVFLDIQLPDGLGFDVLTAIDQPSFMVIFTTQHDAFAIRAIQFSALDYLIKPIDIESFNQSIDKLLRQIDQRLYHQKIETLIQNINSCNKIALPSANSIRFVIINDIVRCEADSNYTWFHLKSGEKVLVSRSLKDYAEMLEPVNFFRVHQSHLINLQYVAAFQKDEGGKVVMEDHSVIYVARRRKDQLMAMLTKQLIKKQ